MTKTKIIFKTLVLTSVAVVIGASIYTYLFIQSDRNDSLGEQSKPVPESLVHATIDASISHIENKMPDSKAALPDALIAFKSQYIKSLEHPSGQIRVVEKLIQYLKSKYGENWNQYLHAYLIKIFPQQADKLLDLSQSMAAYQAWLRTQQDSLKILSPDTRRAMIWEQRVALFGEKRANAIWQAELRNQKINDVLKEIETHDAQSFNEQYASYIQSVNDIYQHSTSAYIDHHRQELMDRFLTVDRVQANLKSLEQSDRLKTLAEFREALGMDEAAIERWTQLDKLRDERRAIGDQYMKAVENLTKQSSEEEHKEMIFKLQNQYFGLEADSIRSEEAQGYFRFATEQVYGQN